MKQDKEPISVATKELGDGKDSEEELLKEINDRFDEATLYAEKNFEAASDDVRFLDGDQWPEGIKEQRDDASRPCLTINRLPSFVDQVTGDQKQNEFSIKVMPSKIATTGNDQDLESVNGKSYSLAGTYEGLIRNIEQLSDGPSIYAQGGQHGAEHGFGYFRIVTEYVDDDVFDQDLRIRPITDAFSVLYDPKMLKLGGPEFADYCFIMQRMRATEFKRLYPGVTHTADFDELPSNVMKNWHYGEDEIIIAEYFKRIQEPTELVLLSNGAVYMEEQYAIVGDELTAAGIKEVRRREKTISKILWYKVTPTEIMKGPTVFPSKYIPVIPVLGKQITVDGYVKLRGVIRHSKDAQRMYNYWRSAATESVALAPKQPYIASTKQLAETKIRKIWETANIDNPSVLPYEETNAPPPTRAGAPGSPVAMVQESTNAAEDMQWTTGIFKSALGAQSNEISGRAIDSRKRQTDTGNFAYSEGMAKAVKYAARVLVDAIPRVYDAQRVIRVLDKDRKTEDFLTINQTVKDEQTGVNVILNDISSSRYDVAVDIGPAATTQRMEAAASMLDFTQTLAQVSAEGVAAIMDLIPMNMNWPNADKFAERLGEVNGQGANTADEEKITPEQVQQIVRQALEDAGAETEGIRAEADRIEAIADKITATAKLVEAQTESAVSKTQVQQLIEASIGSLLQQLSQGSPQPGGTVQ
jgi:hypothetical protein